MGKSEAVLLCLCLWAVQLLQWLSQLLLPPLQSALGELVRHLQRRRRSQLLAMEMAARRARGDAIVSTFLCNKLGVYDQLQRQPDMGSRCGKLWYSVCLRNEEDMTSGQKLLTVSALPTDCPLRSLDAATLKSLNTFCRQLKHPLLHVVEEVWWGEGADEVVLVQPLMARGSLKDIIHKTSPCLSWSNKYDRYGKSAVVTTGAMLKTLNKLRKSQDQLLHSIQEVHYCPDSEEMRVTIVEPVQPNSSSQPDTNSLTRLLALVSPTRGGERNRKGLSSSLIASYGRQILEATLFLYGVGFRPLGHIRTGNVFVDGEMCRLGGYENRLLGYKTRFHDECDTMVGCHDIDSIMLGHVIFEMGCGREAKRLILEAEDYKDIKDTSVRGILLFIFNKPASSLEQVLAQPFFADAALPSSLANTAGGGGRGDHTPSLNINLQSLLHHKHPKRRHQCSLQ